MNLTKQSKTKVDNTRHQVASKLEHSHLGMSNILAWGRTAKGYDNNLFHMTNHYLHSLLECLCNNLDTRELFNGSNRCQCFLMWHIIHQQFYKAHNITLRHTCKTTLLQMKIYQSDFKIFLIAHSKDGYYCPRARIFAYFHKQKYLWFQSIFHCMECAGFYRIFRQVC